VRGAPSEGSGTGRLSGLRLTPMRIKRFKANHASSEESRWLKDTINREARRFDPRVELRDDHRLVLR
jgi:poly-gamma-glutamate capsule biosynthesis protein CapA/YwtB (metallophosphatase superfamily)